MATMINQSAESYDLPGARIARVQARAAQAGRRGCALHEGRLRVKVLVYGYAMGVFSSRKLARKLHEDVALRSSRRRVRIRLLCEQLNT